MQNSRSILKEIIEYIFPPKCIGCSTPGVWLCSKCRNTYLIEPPPECVVCRKLSQNFETHSECQTRHNFMSKKVVICWRYNKLAKKIMRAFKYNLRYRAISSIIDLSTGLIRSQIPRNTILVPVPSHRSTLKERGFNQTELIAKEISEQLQLPVFHVLLRRSRRTHQAGRSKEERMSLKATEFDLKQEAIDLLKNKNVAIVDDVCTTGRTMQICTQLIQRARPKNTFGIALFRGNRTNC